MSTTAKVLSFRAAHLVMQDEVWEGNDGPVRIDDMDPGRRRALLGWLRRHAEGLHDARLVDLALQPGFTVDDERALHAHKAVEPAVWLEDTPLVRRLATLDTRARFLRHPRRWWR